MLGIRTLLGLEPKGEILTSAPDAVLVPWMGMLTLENIPGRWGRATVTAKGDEKAVLSTKEIYQQVLSRRATLGERKASSLNLGLAMTDVAGSNGHRQN